MATASFEIGPLMRQNNTSKPKAARTRRTRVCDHWVERPYPYKNENGDIAFWAIRIKPEYRHHLWGSPKVVVATVDNSGIWLRPGPATVPYRLPELLALSPGD